jgi:hypothetical protein
MGHVLLIGYVDHDLIPLYLMALSNATYISCGSPEESGAPLVRLAQG